jgi:indole-3-glycerol phosphate synthase/phosphoribosylanthranilate isomerase
MSAATPIDWQRVRAAAEAQAATLGDLPLSEVTPSRRDFTQFIGNGRREVSVIGTLRRRNPLSGATWSDLDFAARAAALDDAEIAALAVTTEPLFHDGRLGDLRLVSEAASAPLLRDEPLVDPAQIYHGRVHGADACIIAVAWVSDQTLAEMMRVARSLHMAAVLGIEGEADAARAATHDRSFVGVRAGRDDGSLDLDRLARLAQAIPGRHAVVLLDDVRPDQWSELRGLVDAALVAGALMETDDPAAAVDRFLS